MSSVNEHSPRKEWHTPQTARIKTLREDANFSFGQIAQQTSIPKSTLWDKYQASIANHTSRRLGNHPNREQARGRPPLLSQEDIWKLETIIKSDPIETRQLSWDMLAVESELDVSGRTIQRAMGTLNYHKCIACRKGWISPRLKKLRKEYAETMLERYPNKEDWFNVRFSDETHFGYGAHDKYRIIRKPGERYCQKCIQEADLKQHPSPKDQKRLHCWAAIGWNFKSDLFWYQMETNTNGKLSHQAYIDQILEPAVRL